MSHGIRDALILVGGKGTRLSAVVSDRPKPLALVAGHPFLDYLIHQLTSQNIHRIILCSGYMGDHIHRYAKERSGEHVEIVVSQEETPLGTGGAILKALPLTQADPLLVLNGDSYCEFNLSSLTAIHRQSGSVASLWLAHVRDASRYGTVDVSCAGKVTEFLEKRNGSVPGWVNAGIYLIDRHELEILPRNEIISLEREVLPGWVEKGIVAVQGGGELVDIGTPESYEYGQKFFAQINLK